ncbi:hypothetical protein TPL01_09670 [Sulfuriferula plumbiphila]|uniref:Uncharacterized protein n=1 Tax=Sulfuriferula plumbiphila TaxID=171865 RepID=A0A512L5S3_9PROT|nr:hypothetical protein SFPGR_25050 [Sulfuriferula plumbiphila]GEP29829.1 hypothetical protein TPL01_09670 [Sulfuriferula plumbiphila]
MRYLVAGGVGVAVHSDGFHAQALQGDDDLLAEFTAAEEHDAGGGGGERSAEFHGMGFQKKFFATEVAEYTGENQGNQPNPTRLHGLIPAFPVRSVTSVANELGG